MSSPDQTDQAARIADLEAELVAKDHLATAQARIAELEAQLAKAAATPAPAPGDGKGNPSAPTHLQVLACGCSAPVLVPAATHTTCDAHGFQPVAAYHELATAPAA
jgi:hypothetical protein